MLHIHARNVNDALKSGLLALGDAGVEVSPRDKLTLEMPEPLTTTFLQPSECVLFHPKRDINPFFHLMEALWILAGSDQVAFLQQFNSKIAQFSDDGVTFHAPYGYRLRYALGFDQLTAVSELLKREPDTRRAVLQIWKGAEDLNAQSLDIPCNDLIMLKLRNNYLNITVCNRSNDVIWGACGTNVVQFSFLQRYIADRIGAQPGLYHQVSDSFHVYPDNPQFAVLLESAKGNWPEDLYTRRAVQTYAPLVSDWHEFDMCCQYLVNAPTVRFAEQHFSEPFFEHVVRPMMILWNRHQEWLSCGRTGAKAMTLSEASQISGGRMWIDWLRAGYEWVRRREDLVLLKDAEEARDDRVQ